MQSEALAGPRRIEWPTRSDVLDALQDRGDESTILVPGSDWTLGEAVHLEIASRSEEQTFRIHGTVVEVGEGEARVSFLADERRRVLLLKTWAQGASVGYRRRRSRRVPVVVPVVLRAGDESIECFSGDVSETGARLQTDHQTPVGSVVSLRLDFSDEVSVSVEARVVGVVGDEPDGALNVEFLFRNPAMRSKLVREVRARVAETSEV